jgi:hypothetical protein
LKASKFKEKPTFELMTYGEIKVWPIAFDTEDQKVRFVEELQELIEKIAERGLSLSRRTSLNNKKNQQAHVDVWSLLLYLMLSDGIF